MHLAWTTNGPTLVGKKRDEATATVPSCFLDEGGKGSREFGES